MSTAAYLLFGIPKLVEVVDAVQDCPLVGDTCVLQAAGVFTAGAIVLIRAQPRMSYKAQVLQLQTLTR